MSANPLIFLNLGLDIHSFRFQFEFVHVFVPVLEGCSAFWDVFGNR